VGKLKDEATGRDSVRGFVVEKGMKGFTAPEQKRDTACASVTSELLFQDVEVPEANLLPKATGLTRRWRTHRRAIAWGVIGAAMSLPHRGGVLEGARHVGKPIGGFQLVQEKLARMLTEITKAQLLCVQLGRLKQVQATAAQVSLASATIARSRSTSHATRTCRRHRHRRVPGDAAHVQPSR
jgi:glutaryl-CoA dehydrogenase